MFRLAKRGVFLGISIGILLLSLFVLSRAIAPPEEAAEGDKVKSAKDVRHLQVETFEKGDQIIKVDLYGNVEAARKLILRAPFTTKVEVLKGIERGTLIPAGQELLRLETTKLDYTIETLKLEQQGLQTRQRQELHLLESLKERREMMEESVKIYADSLDVHRKKYENRRKLFEKSETLYESRTLSEIQYVERELQYQQAQLEWDEVRKGYLAQVMALAQLDEELGRVQASLESSEQAEKKLALTLAERRHEREKAFLSVDFPARIGKIAVDAGDEVALGEELIQVLSADESIVQLNLPDHYLRWVYQENLLHQTYPREEGSPKITITQIAGNDERVFSGVYLKAIGEALNEPTRSLPLIVARKQSMSAHDEILLPGTYVRVTIELSTVENVYSLPSQALQEGNRLFLVKDGEEEGEQLLHIVEPEVLHRDAERMIVRFPAEEASSKIVVHRLKNVYEDMPVQSGETR